MSIQAIAAVLEAEIDEAGAKLLLICLANAHNNGTGLCCPSISRLEREASMSRSTVKRWLKWLVEHELVEAVAAHAENGRQKANTYRLLLGEGSKLTPSPKSPEKVGVQNDPLSRFEPGEGFTPEPPILKPEEIYPPLPPLFDAFEEVVKAWPKLTPDQETQAWHLWNELPQAERPACLAGARKYPEVVRKEAARRGRTLEEHRRYTKSLPAWIKEKKWQGEKPLPSTNGYESLQRTHPLFERCCAIEGKAAWALEAAGVHFKRTTVAQARSEAADDEPLPSLTGLGPSSTHSLRVRVGPRGEQVL